MSILKEVMTPPTSGEVVTHEGVMDMFKSKNIKTTERTLQLIDSLNILQSYDDKNWCYEADYFLENSKTLKTTFETFLNVNKNKILEYNKYLSDFLNGNKKYIIINKDSKHNFKNLSLKSVLSELKKGLNSESKFHSIFNIVIKNNEKFLKIKENKDLEKQQELFNKVIDMINKENEFTTDEITKETAINQDWLDTQTAIKEYLVVAEPFTTESASNFIVNIKNYFSNALMGINNVIGNFMKTYTVTDKYFKDNVTALNSKNNIINNIISKKFFEIESIETKCVVGMKLNYVGTTKELKVFLNYFKETKTAIDSIASFVENLYNNHNDARLSNIEKVYNLEDISYKTNAIIVELIDGKSVKENVTIGNLFPNSNSIKITKEDLLEINTQLMKADIEGFYKSVNRLTSVLNVFLKEINDNEAVYSKYTISQLQYTVGEIANIITNFGTFLVLSNQFTSYYLTTLDVVNDKIKVK